MNKRLFLSMFLLVSIFISSCQRVNDPRWIFTKKDGNTRTFYKDEWSCFYRKEKDLLYAECFSKENNGSYFFYAEEVEDIN